MYYCGVCKSIGRNFGQFPRFGLINEAAILAIIMDLAASKVNFSTILNKNCIAHPFKKSNYISKSDGVDYAAAINVMLMYYKLQDNVNDDKSIISSGAKRILKNGFKKAVKMYPIAADSIYFSLQTLSKLEDEKCSCIDEAAEPFAYMMKDIFRWKDNDIFCLNYDKLEILGNMGYNVGKWIYLIDALSDIEDDSKTNSYNVLLNKYPHGVDSENIIFLLEMCLSMLSEQWEHFKEILKHENDFDNIKYVNSIGVLDNLIYIGMRHITDVKAGKKNEPL